MQRWRSFSAVLLSITVAIGPIWGAGEVALGTVVSATRATLGTSSASAGTTVYGGDHLTTDELGNLQVRAGAARLHLSPKTNVVLTDTDGQAGAVLYSGTATFSTANAKAFALRAASATFRPGSDKPTIAQVSLISPKEFVVRTTRGPVSVTVEDETQIIPEGNSYRVLVDPEPTPEPAPPQGPQGAGAFRVRAPHRAGRSHFTIVVIAAVAVLTYFAVDEALESPDRPR